MYCPVCGKNDMQIVISTRRPSTDYIVRRRQCECGFRFNTVEIMEINRNVMKKIEKEMRINSDSDAFENAVQESYRKLFDRKHGGDAG